MSGYCLFFLYIYGDINDDFYYVIEDASAVITKDVWAKYGYLIKFVRYFHS